MKSLAYKMCIHSWVVWDVSYFSTYKNRWVWRRIVFAGADGSREGPGVFPGSHWAR